MSLVEISLNVLTASRLSSDIMLQIQSDEQQCENPSFTASYSLTVYFKCMKNYVAYDQKKYSNVYY